jgi:alkanesulfonate monooxygenase SsuD/methylene tetrahydromethanopterin reductase-like flavin-dependent oxidoreductase (luciferase family)
MTWGAFVPHGGADEFTGYSAAEAWGLMVEAVKAQHFMGSPDEVLPKVQAFADAGARHIVIMCLDPSTAIEHGRRFLQDVAPNVRL